MAWSAGAGASAAAALRLRPRIPAPASAGATKRYLFIKLPSVVQIFSKTHLTLYHPVKSRPAHSTTQDLAHLGKLCLVYRQPRARGLSARTMTGLLFGLREPRCLQSVVGQVIGLGEERAGGRSG